MLGSFATLFVWDRALQSLLRVTKHVVWMATVLLSLNAYAMDQSDGGCTESGGQWTCTGDVIVVTGEPVDSFDCRKNPANCVPVDPPGSSTVPHSTSATSGREIKEAEVLNQAVLRSMDCGELSDQESLYKAYVETAKALLEMHKASLKQADDRLKSVDFSETEMDFLLELRDVACTTYQLTKRQRLNGPKECFDRPTKSQICHAPSPTALELQQLQRCQSNSRDLSARQGDLASWKSRKAAAESNIQTMSAEVRNNEKMLDKIRTEKKKKKCAS